MLGSQKHSIAIDCAQGASVAFTVCCNPMPFSSFLTSVLARKADFISKIHRSVVSFFYVVEGTSF